MVSRQPLKVSVTLLEKYRRYTSGLDTEESFIESLTGAFKGNDKTWIGSAFHKIIEKPTDVRILNTGKVKWAIMDGIAFPLEAARVAARFSKAHPAMIYEVPASKMYDTGKHLIMVSGRLDGIDGMMVRDTKLKFMPPYVSEYQDSFQWRFYLDMIGTKYMEYDIFEVIKYSGMERTANGIYFLDKISIKYHEPIPCLAYKSMPADCKNLVSYFMDYIETHNLFHHLKPAENVKAVIL